jgi:hypothetical protein
MAARPAASHHVPAAAAAAHEHHHGRTGQEAAGHRGWGIRMHQHAARRAAAPRAPPAMPSPMPTLALPAPPAAQQLPAPVQPPAVVSNAFLDGTSRHSTSVLLRNAAQSVAAPDFPMAHPPAEHGDTSEATSTPPVAPAAAVTPTRAPAEPDEVPSSQNSTPLARDVRRPDGTTPPFWTYAEMLGIAPAPAPVPAPAPAASTRHPHPPAFGMRARFGPGRGPKPLLLDVRFQPGGSLTKRPRTQ